MNQWAKVPAPRHQLVLISQTLDDLVAPDHPVRLLDAFLDELDWRGWEAHFTTGIAASRRFIPSSWPGRFSTG